MMVPLYALTGALVWAIYTLTTRARDVMTPPQVEWSGDIHVSGGGGMDFAPVTPNLAPPDAEIAQMQQIFAQIDPMDGVIPYIDNDWDAWEAPIDEELIENENLFNNLLGIGDEDV